MNQQLRVVVAIIISVVIWIAWQALFMEKPPVHGGPDAGPATARAPAAPTPPPAALPGFPPPHEETAAPPEENVLEEPVDVSTPLWDARFTTRGGALASFRLKGEKQMGRPVEGKRQPFELVHPTEGMPLPLSADIGGPGAGFAASDAWKIAGRTADSISFERSRGGLSVVKRIAWKPDSYVLSLDITASRAAGTTAAPVPVTLRYPSFETPSTHSGGMFSLTPTPEVQQAVCLARGARSMETYQFAPDKPQVTYGQRPAFAGIDRKYFLAAMAPADDASASACTLSGLRPGALAASLQGSLQPPAGGSASASFVAFLGPKDVDRLQAADHEMERSIDFGFFAVICRVLLAVLRLFHGVLANWGLAIVALTLLVKAVTFPLTHKQMKSMEEMRRLAPKLEEIKKRWTGDQQRINLESMKLYKEHNVQPLGGCLPMLVQMPVWFALYATLSASWDLYNEPFIRGWIGDLTAIDPYYVLPVLMTVTMLLSQILTPQPQANQQQKFLMYGMPLIFGVMMLALPSGLVLYIFTNNILSIGQSLWFRRKFGAGAPEGAKA